MKKHLKKIIAGVIAAIGAVFIGKGIGAKVRGNVSVSIIGGADGPTSIFLAGKVGDGLSGVGIGIGFILLIIAIIVFFVKKKNK